MYHDLHQSGFHGAKDYQRVEMNDQIARTGSIAMITEYLGQKFKSPLPNDLWGEFGHESVIVWAGSKWVWHRGGTAHIPTVTWKRGNSVRHDVDVTWSLFSQISTGLMLFRFGGHIPAHLFKFSQRKANEQALLGMEKALGPHIKRYKPDEISGSFDFNRELRLQKNQDLIHKAFSPLGLHLHVPPGTTHHPMRRIDGFVTSVKHEQFNMLAWKPGYDHRGVRRESA